MRTAALLVLLMSATPVRAPRTCPRALSRSGTASSPLGTDISISATPQDDGDGAWFNYTDYEHNALRLFRIGVTADVRLTDRISVLTEIRSENGDGVKPYALYVRVRPWRDRPIDIQAGRHPSDVRRIFAARLRSR